jgi:hypothetical protein
MVAMVWLLGYLPLLEGSLESSPVLNLSGSWEE